MVTDVYQLNITSSMGDGDTLTFQVKLSITPATDVTVAVALSDSTRGTLSPTSLTFTNANAGTYQTVTLTLAADSDVIVGRDYFIELTATGTALDISPAYAAVEVQDLRSYAAGTTKANAIPIDIEDGYFYHTASLVGRSAVSISYTCSSVQPAGSLMWTSGGASVIYLLDLTGGCDNNSCTYVFSACT